MTPSKVRVGIGGQSFEPWRETFYPEGLRQKDEMSHAAAHMTTIEINVTYYRHNRRRALRDGRHQRPMASNMR